VIEGMNGLLARLRSLGNTEPMMREVARAGVEEAKRLVPYRTGNLARTIRAGRISADGAEIVAGGMRTVGYASFVEFGTVGGQIIRPRRKKALAWATSASARRLSGTIRSANRRSGQGVAFAMWVRRGSTRAQPFLGPGLQKGAEAGGIDAIVQVWNEAD
jgi:hypothetical protein